MTTSSNYAYASLDDIVFEGRNREYGAYLLRKIYTRNLWRGLVTAIALFMLLLSLPIILKKLWPDQKSETIIIEPVPIEFQKVIIEPKPVIPDPVPEPQKNTSQPATAPTVKLVNPTISATAPTDFPEVLPPGIEAGVTTNTGTGGKTAIDNPGTGTQPVIEVLPEKIWEYAEVNPAFPGGEEAMMKYLSSHIRYPSVAERNKLEGLVVVQFVVNEAGAITDMVILKKLGGGTDEEAMRVIKNMPPWQPGKQNGRPVKVRFTLPIRFTINR
jgi:protein TonB